MALCGLLSSKGMSLTIYNVHLLWGGTVSQLLMLCLQQVEAIEIACPEHFATHNERHNACLQSQHTSMEEADMAAAKATDGASRANVHQRTLS